VWWTLTPVGTSGASTTETRGIAPVAWIGIIAGLVIIVAAIVLGRRRRIAREDEA
jgi:hypothetical protein